VSTELTVAVMNLAVVHCVEALEGLEVPKPAAKISLPAGVLDFNGVYREVEGRMLEAESPYTVYQGRPATFTAKGWGRVVLPDLGTLSGWVVSSLEAICKHHKEEFVDVDSYDVHHTIFKKEVVGVVYAAIGKRCLAMMANAENF